MTSNVLPLTSRQGERQLNRQQFRGRVGGLAARLGAARAAAFAAVVLALVVVPGCGGEASSELTLEACTVDGAPARCGTVMVPEDRSGDGDHQLPVRVVVFPATGPDRQPDPVVWFAVGPGDSAVDIISRVHPLLAPNHTSTLPNT